MNKKRIDKYANFAPICVFGPGGEFQDTWPIPNQRPVTAASAGPIGKLLDIIAEMAGLTEQTDSEEIQTKFSHEGLHNEKSARQNKYFAASVSGALCNFGTYDQQTLFSDDSRCGNNIKYKPQHRIRTHRRPSRTRPVKGFDRQGTLFEANGLSISAA